ncbi:MAG TPA: cupin domain-containing protein [Chitinophagaceae bacterium]|jgi:quercetin dioxygenase-like cupin family protein|nr:cupin domain-containing protein [Chitinophagaceae bacterium]
MEDKSVESTPLRPDGGRITDAPKVDIDLDEAIRQIKQETSWQTGDRNAITLFKSAHLRVVLVALHEGAEMTKHTAEGVISIQVLEGLISFDTEQSSKELSAGKMLVLHEGIPHLVKAKKETVFLLTLAPLHS